MNNKKHYHQLELEIVRFAGINVLTDSYSGINSNGNDKDTVIGDVQWLSCN